ncbi:hypothetical protein HAP47_0005265 [Bradyrhizobium sp. 41S5]|uniref:hypothetical protein n=1 Tax=Bradyrhizobium sp. 41S5 TaxID=1404443 RepID=UPI00156AED53|nr:hypothetical protein [Bradyrhizobium sp. 41S5]UFX46121.1 hypothetical protein HAP47_0005265 [Bradyrhizobium sp. 41S5]
MKTIGWLTVIAGLLIGLLGLFVLVVTVIIWFKFGTWSPLGLNALWGGGDLSTDWVGLDRLAKMFHNFPIGMLIFFAGLGIVHLGISLVERADWIATKEWRSRISQ